jgi:predicted flap endonuclease-1-like 5' DNA nuclease
METKPADVEGLEKSTSSALETDKKQAETTAPEKKAVETSTTTDPAPAAADVPDPDEDDLDDLDGMY